MPRFVRPAFLTVDTPERARPLGTGPRSRDGNLTAFLTLRTRAGTVSDAVRIDAGGSRPFHGDATAEILIPDSMDVRIERTANPRDASIARYRISIRPL